MDGIRAHIKINGRNRIHVVYVQTDFNETAFVRVALLTATARLHADGARGVLEFLPDTRRT